MPSNLPMIGVRLSPALKQAAERAAAADGRSLSNWIARLIEREVAAMTQTVTITNDFHSSKARVRVPEDGILSVPQVRRVRRELCGISDCTCGGALGERGGQVVEIEPLSDGRVRLTQTEYRAAYVGDCRLTGPEHQHLDDADLLAEAVRHAEEQGLIGGGAHQITTDMIQIGTWR